MRTSVRNRVLALGVACTSCNSVPAEPDRPAVLAHQLATPPALGAAPASSVAGFVHAIDRSRFQPGAGPSSVTEKGFRKVTGAFGVFAVDEVNGAVLASRSSGAVRTQYPSSVAAHNAEVRAYFVQAGIPEIQIGTVMAHTAHRGDGPAVGPDFGPGPAAALAGISTVLARQVGRFPVVESVAWADLDADGKVVAETVYWPPLPGSVVEDAEAFSSALADPTAGAAFRAALPPSASSGRVVIHHTPMTHHGPFEARATYDVTASVLARAGHTRHFDREGREVALWRDGASAPARTDAK